MTSLISSACNSIAFPLHLLLTITGSHYTGY
nr:MAG TPA: hypothetical protein [Caudoviricetes sp.]